MYQQEVVDMKNRIVEGHIFDLHYYINTVKSRRVTVYNPTDQPVPQEITPHPCADANRYSVPWKLVSDTLKYREILKQR